MITRIPQWNDLRVLAHIMQAGSLTGAARCLGIDHSTVSRRLVALEKALGTTLVIRGADGAQLTEAGQRLVPLLQEMMHLTTQVVHIARQQSARVRVTMPSGFARYFSRDLDFLRERGAGIELELQAAERHFDVEEGESDLAIRIGDVQDDRLVARWLCKAGGTLYAAPSYLARVGTPVDMEDLRGHDLIGYGQTLSHTPSAQWLEARTPGARVVLRINEVAEMVPAALRGVGLALLPCALGDSESGLVRITPTVLIKRDVSLVYRRVSRLANPVRVAIDIVSEIVLKHAVEIEGESKFSSGQ